MKMPSIKPCDSVSTSRMLLSVQIQLLALFALDLAAGLPAKSLDQFSLSVFLLESSIYELV